MTAEEYATYTLDEAIVRLGEMGAVSFPTLRIPSTLRKLVVLFPFAQLRKAVEEGKLKLSVILQPFLKLSDAQMYTEIQTKPKLKTLIISTYEKAIADGIIPPPPPPRGSIFKRIGRRIRKKIIEPIKELGQKIGTQFGWSKDVREQIRRDVYRPIFNGVWGKMGLDLVGINVALEKAVGGGLGQFAELAMSVIPTLTGKISSGYALEVQGRATAGLEEMTGRFGDSFEKAQFLLKAKGVAWAPATPEEAEEYAGQFAKTEETQFQGRYYFALEKILLDIQDKTKVLEADPVIAKAAADAAKRVGEHFDAALARPEVASIIAGRGWSLAAVKTALMKVAAGTTLTAEETEMANEVGKLIKKPEEVPGWTAMIVPGAIMALSIL